MKTESFTETLTLCNNHPSSHQSCHGCTQPERFNRYLGLHYMQKLVINVLKSAFTTTGTIAEFGVLVFTPFSLFFVWWIFHGGPLGNFCPWSVCE